MAEYDGDEQLQDAFEEGNGDANNDEVRGLVSCTLPYTFAAAESET